MTSYHEQHTATRSRIRSYDTPLMRTAMIICALVAVVMYVVQTSTLATRTFVIHDLETELRSLEQEQRRLDIQIAEARALRTVESRLAGTEFVETTQVAYLSTPGTIVAQR